MKLILSDRGDPMDQHFKANAVLSVFCKNDMELKKGLPICSSEMGVLSIIVQTPGPICL